MPFYQFVTTNWLLFTLLVLVIIAIIIYEIKNIGQNNYSLSNITASQVINQGAILIDIRTVDEFRRGHIAGAINIPIEKFDDYLQQRNTKKDATYLLYCKNGMTAANQSHKMQQQNFSHVYVLKMGFDGWLADNLPIV